MKQKYFTVSLCALTDINGKTIYRSRYLSNVHIPELFAHLQSTTRRRIVLMGKSTFKTLIRLAHARETLFVKDRLVLVVTKSKHDVCIPEGMAIIAIDSLSYLPQIWKILNEEERNLYTSTYGLTFPVSEEEPTRHIPIIGPFTEHDIIVIGGKTLYNDMLPYAKYIHQYRVYGDCIGETTFPILTDSEWSMSEPKAFHREDDTKTPLFVYVHKKRIASPPKKLSAIQSTAQKPRVRKNGAVTKKNS